MENPTPFYSIGGGNVTLASFAMEASSLAPVVVAKPQDNFFDNTDYFDKTLEDLINQRPELANFYRSTLPRNFHERRINDPLTNISPTRRRDFFPRHHFGDRFSTESPSSPNSESQNHYPVFSRRYDKNSPSSSSHRLIDSATQTNDELDSSKKTDQNQGLTQYNLRNTVDLGQTSSDGENLSDKVRNKRSMSAPPDNRIPCQNASDQSGSVKHNNASTINAKPNQEQSNDKQPVEHIIPILVEGRDEPLINKIDAAGNFAEPKHQETDDRFFEDRSFRPHFNDLYGGSPRINRIFSNEPFGPTSKFSRPSRFSQEHEQPSKFTRYPDESQQKPFYHHEKNRHPEPHQDVEQKQTGPSTKGHKVHLDNEVEQQPINNETQPNQQPQTHPNDPIQKIQLIQNDVLALMSQVENFSGKTKKDKEYVYLDEMLTRNLLKLDDIDTDGKENIRLARKEAIKCIQQCIAVLEAKAESASKNNASENYSDANKNLTISQDSEKDDSQPGILNNTNKIERTDADGHNADNESSAKQIDGMYDSNTAGNSVSMETENTKNA